MKDILIKERFRVDRNIGEGGCGRVYIGTDIQSGEEVAIKLERWRDEPEMLKNEERVYKILTGGRGIPRFIWAGEECEYYVLISELLGPSLEDLFNYCDRRFSLKTVLLLADQVLSRIEYIHSKSIVHGDIKPDNLLMGSGKSGNTVFVADFGLAMEASITEQHLMKEGCGFYGTTRYASINTHKGLEQSQRDDLESLGYVLVYFIRGYLPWQGLKAPRAEKRKRVAEMKQNLAVEQLCEDLPVEFHTYIKYARSLSFKDQPDYKYLRKLFRRVFERKGFAHDNLYDWTMRMFLELQKSSE